MRKMKTNELFRAAFAPTALAFFAALGVGCTDSARHAAAMAEARRLRGQTAFDGRPSFGEPYGEWGREKVSDKWGN